ncbi:hypothetical protein Tco_0602218, partial [Tanacetum coccineum]
MNSSQKFIHSLFKQMANLEFYDKYNMVAYLEKSEGSTGFHEIIDFLSASHIHYALTENPTIYVSFIKQFWSTAADSTRANGEVELTATIDGHTKTLTEASLRRHLKLEDIDGVSTLPNLEIFEQLALMGRHLQPHTRTYAAHSLINKVFSNMKRVSRCYSGVEVPLFPTMLTAPDTSPSRITSSHSLSSKPSPSTLQPQNTDAEEPAPTPHESPLKSVHSLGRDEGSLSLNELTVLCTNLSNKVTSLEVELAQTKQTYSNALTRLIKRVKKLEQTIKTSKDRRKARIIVSEEEDIAENSSKQGRKISDIDEDPNILLKKGSGEKGQPEVTTTDTALNTAGVSISTASATHVVSTAGRIVYIRRSAEKRKDKGKIDEEERAKITRDVEIAKQLQEEIDTAGQQKVVTEDDQSQVIDWSDPFVIRYHTLQNRPRSVAEVKKIMCICLKNQRGYKMKDFKGMSYEEIRPIFEKVWDFNHAFAPKDSDIEKEVMKRSGFDIQQEPKKVKGSLKRKTSEERMDITKKQKTDKQDQKEEKIIKYMEIIPIKEIAIDAITLATKPPMIVDLEIISEGKIVKGKYGDARLEEAYERVLWGDLKVMFEPDIDSEKGDDPIDAINHMMSFLTAVITSRYLTTNNQL